MLALILEAAFRSLLMACAVWAGMRLLRVHPVMAQKVAWVMVLAAAALMPVMMRVPLPSLGSVLEIPVRRLAVDPSLRIVESVRARSSVLENYLKAEARADAPSEASGATPSKFPLTQTAVPRRAHFAVPSALVRSPSPSASQASPQAAAGSRLLMQIPIVLAGAYLLICGVLLLRTFAGAAIAWRIWRRARAVDGLDVGEGLALDGLRIRVSRELSTPVTIGRCVILPAGYADWDEAKLRIVLAHEQSHVRQGDFYVQLLAAVHAAIFWFSPLGWWLRHKLSELGEALSDGAGLAQAADRSAYAQVLLEFAAMPRPTLAGVGMARTSNLSSRIERILNDHRFRLAFLGGRRHAVMAAVLVPAALLTVVTGIRILPAVEAAQQQRAAFAAATTHVGASGAVNDAIQEVPATQAAQSVAPPASAPAAQAPAAPPAMGGPETPEAPEVEAPERPEPPEAPEFDGESIAVVHGGSANVFDMNGKDEKAFEQVRKQRQGDYIWFMRDGKSYIIDDPALVARASSFNQHNEAFERLQAQMELKQAEQNKRMEAYAPQLAKLDMNSPEMKAQMARLSAELAELNSEKFKKMTAEMSKEVNQEVLQHLQEKMGEIQQQIGEIQGRIGEEMGSLGEKQGQIGEEMGKLGEEMGKLGEQQGKAAEEAARKLQSMIDQAVKDGKARPVQ